MKKINISLGIVVAVFLSIVPQASQAYFTTEQTATKVTGSTAMYTIEYRFGLQNQDIYMPIVTQRELEIGSEEKKVGYSMREDAKAVRSDGVAVGIVLSNAPIVNGMYKISKGISRKMTLLVIYSAQTDSHEADYALQIDKLPYYVDMGGAQLEMRQLNSSEMQYYITPEIELNEMNTM